MLGLGWTVRDGYGWGVFGLNLVLETVRHGWAHPVPLNGFQADGLDPGELELLGPWARSTPRARPGDHPFPILHALGNGLAAPPTDHRGRPDLGVIFLEDTHLTGPTVDQAFRRYAGLLAGSQWNADLLTEAGAPAVYATPQGVDTSRFRPRPRTGRWRERFVVFSGGKLEPRKGQDLTVAAFRAFRERCPEALLVTAWHSPWPALARSLGALPTVRAVPELGAQGVDVTRWLTAEGLPPEAFVDLGAVGNREMPAVLAECDVALLPSRAEGGTNLVAMECLASGLPTLLSANTGHLDLIREVPCLALRHQAPFAWPETGTVGWGSSDLDEIVAGLETLAGNATLRQELRDGASAAMQRWAWAPRIEALVRATHELTSRAA